MIKKGDRVLTWYGEGEIVGMNVCGMKGLTRVKLDNPPPYEYNLSTNPALFFAHDLKRPEEVEG